MQSDIDKNMIFFLSQTLAGLKLGKYIFNFHTYKNQMWPSMDHVFKVYFLGIKTYIYCLGTIQKNIYYEFQPYNLVVCTMGFAII